ncbi:MAG: antibiotic biosynthesis monooxygenase [Draconibacterium sp.]|nr:antibiotic biosynthesis monooxygenase [Draconibacterium sp.]
MISIIAKFSINNGEESKFLTLINGLIELSLTEEGCIEYALQKHTEKTSTYCLIEKWEDSEAVDFHNNTPHFTNTVPKLIKIAKVEIDVYKPV